MSNPEARVVSLSPTKDIIIHNTGNVTITTGDATIEMSFREVILLYATLEEVIVIKRDLDKSAHSPTQVPTK